MHTGNSTAVTEGYAKTTVELHSLTCTCTLLASARCDAALLNTFDKLDFYSMTTNTEIRKKMNYQINNK
jgi:hypothetical protein